MHVGIVNKLLNASGSSRWSAGMSRGLAQLGNQVDTIFIRDSQTASRMGEALTGLNVEVYLTGTAAAVSRWLGAPAISLWLGSGFDVQSAPDVFSWIGAPALGRWGRRAFDLFIAADEYIGLACMSAYILHRTPYVVFFQEAVASDEPTFIAKTMKTWRRKVVTHARLLVANSSRVAKSYAEMLGRQVISIPHGCNPAPSCTLTKGRYVLADTRWSRWRDPYFLIEIARRLPEVNFVMAGSFTPLSFRVEFVKVLQASGLSGRVRLADGLSETALEELYHNALCYVRWAAHSGSVPVESGPSLGVYQALSHGCPIIVDRDLSLDDPLVPIVGPWVVRRDADEFASRIRKLVEDQDIVADYSRGLYATSHVLSWQRRASDLLAALVT